MQAFVGCFSGKPSPFIALVKSCRFVICTPDRCHVSGYHGVHPGTWVCDEFNSDAFIQIGIAGRYVVSGKKPQGDISKKTPMTYFSSGAL
uniref:Uncharacterized protein n=1 Tax=Klebsiella pneumoniae TaxID=573 RepID=A0A8B0SX17_KLEPN|nr:hypothetical protein [Klebsiella pneumoniae]